MIHGGHKPVQGGDKDIVVANRYRTVTNQGGDKVAYSCDKPVQGGLLGGTGS